MPAQMPRDRCISASRIATVIQTAAKDVAFSSVGRSSSQMTARATWSSPSVRYTLSGGKREVVDTQGRPAGTTAQVVRGGHDAHEFAVRTRVGIDIVMELNGVRDGGGEVPLPSQIRAQLRVVEPVCRALLVRRWAPTLCSAVHQLRETTMYMWR